MRIAVVDYIRCGLVLFGGLLIALPTSANDRPNIIYLMTDGGPNLRFGEPGETDILITYVYDVAFRDGAYGVAAAWSVVIFLMLVAFSWVYMKRTNATEASA